MDLLLPPNGITLICTGSSTPNITSYVKQALQIPFLQSRREEDSQVHGSLTLKNTNDRSYQENSSHISASELRYFYYINWSYFHLAITKVKIMIQLTATAS